MEILNISRLGNQINGFSVIGINGQGSLVLCGLGEEITSQWLSHSERSIIFYEYDPVNDELKADTLKNVKIPEEFLIQSERKISSEYGIGYFFDLKDEEKINIVKYDFIKNTYECLFSITNIRKINTPINRVQLFALTDNFLAVKVYDPETCQIYIYDIEEQKKYNLLFSDSDDMREAEIKYLDVDGIPHILFIKYGHSDIKMENYIHKWEWTEDSKKYKDEKIFLFSLEELINKGSIFLDNQYKIAEANENYELYYHGYINSCIQYSLGDLRKHDKEEIFEDKLFFHDIDKKQIIKNIIYHGNVLISDNGSIYERKGNREQLILMDLNKDTSYKLPYQNVRIKGIIDEYLILDFGKGLIIYDFKNEKELGKYYTEDEKLYILPQVRNFAISLNYKYFRKKDLLVLY
jgi:hypothetical protein